MKAYIDKDEWYPVYTVDEERSYMADEIEVDEEAMRRWHRAHLEFNKAQDEMEAAYKSQVRGGA